MPRNVPPWFGLIHIYMQTKALENIQQLFFWTKCCLNWTLFKKIIQAQRKATFLQTIMCWEMSSSPRWWDIFQIFPGFSLFGFVLFIWHKGKMDVDLDSKLWLMNPCGLNSISIWQTLQSLNPKGCNRIKVNLIQSCKKMKKKMIS